MSKMAWLGLSRRQTAQRSLSPAAASSSAFRNASPQSPCHRTCSETAHKQCLRRSPREPPCIADVLGRNATARLSRCKEANMRLFATALAVLTFTTLPLVPASAQNQTAQQERMKACNTQASNQKLAGDAR